MATYLPKSRNLLQIVNRAGRYGANGNSHLMLNRKRLKQRIGKRSLPSSFFSHTHLPEQKVQDTIERHNQLHRLVTFGVSDFVNQLQDVFFAHCSTEEGEERSKQLVKWAEFHSEATQLWAHVFGQTRALFRKGSDRKMFGNTRAWLKGEGTIFANLKALFRREMTLGQYLFPVKGKDCQDTLPSMN